jgi:hypothetical protein
MEVKLNAYKLLGFIQFIDDTPTLTESGILFGLQVYLVKNKKLHMTADETQLYLESEGMVEVLETGDFHSTDKADNWIMEYIQGASVGETTKMFTLLVKVGMKTKEGKKILKELKKEGST